MGWSKPNPGRQGEATARAQAMASIHFTGPLDADGYPIDGSGIHPRCFFAGSGRCDPNFDAAERAAMDAEAMTDLVDSAQDNSVFGGGFQRGVADGLDDDEVAWPHGYRWGRSQ